MAAPALGSDGQDEAFHAGEQGVPEEVHFGDRQHMGEEREEPEPRGQGRWCNKASQKCETQKI